MPTFDIVSEVDKQEVKNAVDQVNKEVSTRFDFKGSDARVEQADYVLTVHSHRAPGAADRKVPTSILLKEDDQGRAAANASYPLHLLLLPHEAAFTAGAGSVPATPGRVRA